MLSNIEAAEIALLNLQLLSCDHVKRCLGDNIDPETSDFDFEDESDGIVIRRVGDTFTVAAEYEEYHRGIPTRVDYRVEYDGDKTELPRVYRDVMRAGDELRPFPVPPKRYAEIAQCIGYAIGHANIVKSA